jgi:acetyltransferase EpsM
MLPGKQPLQNLKAMSDVCLYGASGHGKVIFDMVQRVGREVFCFIDDNQDIISLNNLTVYPSEKVDKLTGKEFVLSIGNNQVRKEISNQLNVSFTQIIDPSAVVSNQVDIADGTVVMPRAVINSSAKIGKHCIVNTGAIIEHDCKIEDFVHISPNATITGNVSVGEGTQIGAGAVVLPNVKIGKWSVIGAGAVIIGDIPDNAVVVGNPGKIIKYNR